MTDALLRFRAERDWERFHDPKSQAISLMLEAAEVAELCQWHAGADLQRHLDARRGDLADELADVLGWVLLMAHDQQIDLPAAFADKLAKNARKYPVGKARGVATKYDRL